MQFSNTTLGSGIVQDIDDWVHTDDSSYPIAKKTKDINAWLDRTISLILTADGRWQFDDSNYENIPIGTGTLTEGLTNCTINGGTFLNIITVEILDKNGKWYYLEAMDEKSAAQPGSGFSKNEDNGRPTKYDKKGDSLFLYPAPSSDQVTLKKGLRISFQRGPVYFTVSDTTKEPGFNPLYHRILSLGPALDFASKNEMTTKVNILTSRLNALETGLVNSYAIRDKDEKTSINLRKEHYGV